MANLTLTAEQVSTLDIYLLITEGFRNDELAACKRLAEEKGEDGKPKYPNMKDNAEWWEKTNKEIENIETILDDYFSCGGEINE